MTSAPTATRSHFGTATVELRGEPGVPESLGGWPQGGGPGGVVPATGWVGAPAAGGTGAGVVGVAATGGTCVWVVVSPGALGAPSPGVAGSGEMGSSGASSLIRCAPWSGVTVAQREVGRIPPCGWWNVPAGDR